MHMLPTEYGLYYADTFSSPSTPHADCAQVAYSERDSAALTAARGNEALLTAVLLYM